jgi:hypothetical protein
MGEGIMFKYYVEVQRDEHYPYADEIADYLWRVHGICSPSGDKPAKVLVRDFLTWFHGDEPCVYYNTRHGLKKVYPLAVKAIRLFLEKCEKDQGYIDLNGKKYKYIRKVQHFQ